MKRIIPFVLLAFVGVACQDDLPTVPDVDPQFDKPNCSEDPSHPSCKDGDDGGGSQGQYTAIDLQHTCKRCDGYAHDINEPSGSDLYVVGWIDRRLGSPPYAVVWTGTRASIGNNNPVELEQSVGWSSVAQGINDAADRNVGAAASSGWPRVPVMWQRDGNGAWSVGTQLPTGSYVGGRTRDVNDSGVIAGRLVSESDSVAAVWTSPASDPVVPYAPDRYKSSALGLNNDGDVVGRIWNENGAKAILWKGGGDYAAYAAYCELAASESVVWRIEDRENGVVLVAGQVNMQPTVWTVDVDVPGCAIIVETIDVSEGRALDVRRTNTNYGWDAVGDQVVQDRLPIVWFGLSGSELLHEKPGYAFAINGDGDIAGSLEQKGLQAPVLWTRN